MGSSLIADYTGLVKRSKKLSWKSAQIRKSDLVKCNRRREKKHFRFGAHLVCETHWLTWLRARSLSLSSPRPLSPPLTVHFRFFVVFSNFSLIKLVISLLLWMSVWITSRGEVFSDSPTSEVIFWNYILKLFNFFFKCFLSTYISLVECVVSTTSGRDTLTII